MNSEYKPSLIFFLLSHHSPEKLNRTIHISIKGRHLYLCARCTGVWTGMMSIFLAFFSVDLPAWLYVLLLAVLPAPATVDWITQSCKLRESRNAIRIGSGFLLGVSWGLFFLSLTKGMLHLFLIGLAIICAYIFLIYIVALKTKFLDNYFN